MLEISTTYENDIDEHGFAIVEDVITPTEVNALRIAIEQAITESQDSTSVRDRGGVYAIPYCDGSCSRSPSPPQTPRHCTIGRTDSRHERNAGPRFDVRQVARKQLGNILAPGSLDRRPAARWTN